jgi:hypothetical protein
MNQYIRDFSEAAPIAPNRSDIARHLYALFAPDFVQAYPDSWIEIAYGDPAVEGGKVNEAKNFSPFKLDDAIAFAEEKNRAGYNIYVGAALRHGERSSSGRASGHHVLAASHAWAEYDHVGDDNRITAVLKEKGLAPAIVLTTGTVPCPRRHVYLKLDHGATPDEIRAANASLKELLGTDAVQNPDRILRLAGTISYPSPEKRDERGYVTELVALHQNRGARAYSPDELIGAAPEGARRGRGYNETEEKPAPTVESFFKNVNALALVQPSHWVKPLFGNLVKFYPSTGCWRTTPEANKRLPGRAHLEEAISISQRGVWDYGFEKPSDPIGLVVDYKQTKGFETGARDAAHWLCSRMHIAPEALGWGSMERRSADDPEYANGYSEGGAGEHPSQEQAPPPPCIQATPYQWVNPEDVAPREWLYARHILRKFVTATAAGGATGKTTNSVVEALVLVTGKPLLGITPHSLCRVWLWNLEDPHEEMVRKIQAACLFYGITKEDIGDRLFLNSGRDTPLVIAEPGPNGTKILRPVTDAFIKEAKARQIDVSYIDPFVSCSTVPENDNVGQDKVVKEWGRVADVCNMGVHLLDHTRKAGADEEPSVESVRGGKAKTDACRSVRVLVKMTKKEADDAGIENPRLYYRAFDGKPNLSYPVEKSEWYKLNNVSLGNGRDGRPSDEMGVVSRWTYPDALADVTASDWDKCAAAIKAGIWRAHYSSNRWVGNCIAQVMGLDVAQKADRKKVTKLIGMWRAAGSLIEYEDLDENSEKRQFIRVRD